MKTLWRVLAIAGLGLGVVGAAASVLALVRGLGRAPLLLAVCAAPLVWSSLEILRGRARVAPKVVLAVTEALVLAGGAWVAWFVTHLAIR